MRVLTPSETEKFLADNRKSSAFLDRESEEWKSYPLSPEAGKRTALAKSLSGWLVERNPTTVAVNIREWSIWPSSENLDLFHSYRKYRNEPRPLIEAAFHLFGPDEESELTNILNLGLLFYWDIEAWNSASEFRFFASRDEYIDLYCPVPNRWESQLAELLAQQTDPV
jgi:hypothetical protein